MKYLKSLLYIFIMLLISSFIITTLNYFNLISNNILKFIKLLLAAISFFIGAFYIGKNSKDKGYLQGIKIAGIIITISFLLNYLGFDKKISSEQIIYYLIILGICVLGSIIGINKKLKQ